MKSYFERDIFLLLRTLNANGVWMLNLLVQKAGCLGALLIVVKCYAIVAPMPDPHPVHIEPPATGVILVHLRAAHFQLQPWGQDMVHSPFQCVIAPMSENHNKPNISNTYQFDPS